MYMSSREKAVESLSCLISWLALSLIHLQQALSESNASKPDDAGARRRPAKLLLQ